MSLIKVLRAGQVTLPADVRRALSLKEGDYLEAELVEGALRLRPVSVVDRAAAWRQVREAQAAVRYVGDKPRPSPADEEQTIYDAVREHRDRHD